MNWGSNNISLSFSKNVLPFTDVVLHNRRNQLGVLLTDDELYHASLTIKELHIYTLDLLDQKNWRYHRVFSRNWWMDQENAAIELTRFVHEISDQSK